MDLSIAGVSAYQQAQLVGKVQTAVDAKVLNLARDQGASALQLLQGAVGGEMRAGDPMAAAATGLGGQLDMYA